MRRNHRAWFGPYPTGFGWGRCTWQGLVVLAIIAVGATVTVLFILGR
jgi:hypothetical protein